jgi:prepilin-type N-terminal cleavage/methylation domain-containing protein
MIASFRRPRIRSEIGFTLLELMVAMAISSLLALLGAASLSTIFDFYSRSMAGHTAWEQLKGAERTLRYEWKGRGAYASLRDDMVSFDTASPAIASANATGASVAYRCLTDESGKIRLIQFLSALPDPSEILKTQKSEQEITLLTDLRYCAFSAMRYSIDENGNHIARWVNFLDKNTPAPLLLRLEIKGTYFDGPPMVFTANNKYESP